MNERRKRPKMFGLPKALLGGQGEMGMAKSLLVTERAMELAKANGGDWHNYVDRARQEVEKDLNRPQS